MRKGESIRLWLDLSYVDTKKADEWRIYVYIRSLQRQNKEPRVRGGDADWAYRAVYLASLYRSPVADEQKDGKS